MTCFFSSFLSGCSQAGSRSSAETSSCSASKRSRHAADCRRASLSSSRLCAAARSALASRTATSADGSGDAPAPASAAASRTAASVTERCCRARRAASARRQCSTAARSGCPAATSCRVSSAQIGRQRASSRAPTLASACTSDWRCAVPTPIPPAAPARSKPSTCSARASACAVRTTRASSAACSGAPAASSRPGKIRRAGWPGTIPSSPTMLEDAPPPSDEGGGRAVSKSRQRGGISDASGPACVISTSSSVSSACPGASAESAAGSAAGAYADDGAGAGTEL